MGHAPTGAEQPEWQRPDGARRQETNGDSTAPYESHIRTSAGQELEVLVSASFEVVQAREHAARP